MIPKCRFLIIRKFDEAFSDTFSEAWLFQKQIAMNPFCNFNFAEFSQIAAVKYPNHHISLIQVQILNVSTVYVVLVRAILPMD